MKKQLRLLILALMSIILLTGCNILGKQANIKLSAEYEALCNSKNTKNKQLCRETMNQLPKFENDVNAYFKEKFGIGDFVLTGINFPYGSFDHGGFNATFQLKSDRYVMITDTFDYKDGKYMIRAATNEDLIVSGKAVLATSLLLAEEFKNIDIEGIEKWLSEIGIKTNEKRTLFFGQGGRYFKEKNLINFSKYAISKITDEDNQLIIDNYINNKTNEVYRTKYRESIKSKSVFQPITYAENDEQAVVLYNKFLKYINLNPNYKELLREQLLLYKNNDLSYEQYVDTREGRVVFNEKFTVTDIQHDTQTGFDTMAVKDDKGNIII